MKKETIEKLDALIKATPSAVHPLFVEAWPDLLAAAQSAARLQSVTDHEKIMACDTNMAELEMRIRDLERSNAELAAMVEKFKDYAGGWRQRLNKTGPDLTTADGGYIPDTVIEELEELCSSEPSTALSDLDKKE